MVTLRPFEALLAGFIVTVGLSFAIAMLFKRFAPDWAKDVGPLDAGYLIGNFGSSFLAAAAGGFSTAWIAGDDVLADVLVLCIVLLIVGGLSALQRRGKLPVPYLLASVAIAPIGSLMGGLVLLRARDML